MTFQRSTHRELSCRIFAVRFGLPGGRCEKTVAACRCFVHGAVGGSTGRARNSVRTGPRLPEAACWNELRRGVGRRAQLEAARLRLHPVEQRRRPRLRAGRGATLRVRTERRVHRRDRKGTLRVGLRAHRSRGPRRQHLGHRQGLGHGRQVQSGRARTDGLRPPKGIGGRGGTVGASEPAAAASRRHVPPADRCRMGLGRQHLHQRWLCQLTRGEVRQKRRLGEVVRRAGHGTWSAQDAPRHRHRRQRQRVCRRPRQSSHPRVRHQRHVPADVLD